MLFEFILYHALRTCSPIVLSPALGHARRFARLFAIFAASILIFDTYLAFCHDMKIRQLSTLFQIDRLCFYITFC